ncbi:MAG: hypothetical protein WDM92_03635 [Caulobacteraceae bacterium]
MVAGGLGRALSLLDADPAGAGAAVKGPEALVLFTAEHGFAGAFSARVLDAVGEPADAALFVLGARGASLAQQRGWRLAWTAPAASQASGVADAARQVAAVLYSGFVRDGFARAEIVCAVAARGGADVRDRPPPDPADRALRLPRAPARPAAAGQPAAAATGGAARRRACVRRAGAGGPGELRGRERRAAGDHGIGAPEHRPEARTADQPGAAPAPGPDQPPKSRT